MNFDSLKRPYVKCEFCKQSYYKAQICKHCDILLDVDECRQRDFIFGLGEFDSQPDDHWFYMRV